MKLRKLLSISALVCGLAVPGMAAEKPKLVVAILVDQLRYDYLERFHDQFTDRGFRLLMEEGAFLTFAHYDYAQTFTGPGHASFLSGCPPSVHGIIGNEWYDRNVEAPINCVFDPSPEGRPVGTENPKVKASPVNFVGDTLADELRLRYQSKIVGISLKDRGAILPVGKRPTGAYWFDSPSGNFITTHYYHDELPAWVKAFNERQLPASYVGKTWTRLLDPSVYAWPDDAAGEDHRPKETTHTFDHVVQAAVADGFENALSTPYGNELLAEFALAAIDGEALGSGPNPDLLSISFSSIDIAGHIFGPYSQEVQDLVLRLDRQLSVLFQKLDEKIGLANVTILLTADHGVAPTTLFARDQKFDTINLENNKILEDLQKKLKTRFAEGLILEGTPVDGNIYLDRAALKEKNLPVELVENFIRDWALQTNEFQAAYTREQLLDGRAPGALGQRVLNGFNAQRSGDVILVQRPFHLPLNPKLEAKDDPKPGTTHGSPYSYDTHVPVLFYGPAFKKGRYPVEFNITDIAPTLAVALRMNEPAGSIGKPCLPILSKQAVTAPDAPKTEPVAK